MRTVDDLVTWLRAQLDDDERLARAADVKQGDPEWWVSPVLASGGEHFTVRSKEDHRPIARVQRLDGDNDEPGAILDGSAAAEHIARHDPARAMAEVDAKRRILDEHNIEHPGTEYQYCRVCHDYSSHDAASAPCLTLRLLALPYAGRPGYREDWRS